MLDKLKKEGSLTTEIANELIGIAMDILRDGTKPDADPADVQKMVDEVSATLHQQFSVRH